mgnify:CR=1 FL=1
MPAHQHDQSRALAGRKSFLFALGKVEAERRNTVGALITLITQNNRIELK